MTTAYFSHPDCRNHNVGMGHPECPERMDAIEDHLRSSGLEAAVERHDVPIPELGSLALAHSERYVQQLDEFLREARDTEDHTAIDADTQVGPGTWGAVMRAAGAAIAATDAVLDGKADNAFCAVRPPGHHATRANAMGFCFYNNVAVAARHALEVRGLKRVAIIDFDVHHGNGTEDIVANDERILMASFFQSPLYPYSGTVPKGPNMINLPIPPYTKGAAIRDAIEAEWIPRLDAHKPEMIFISAGFDAHRDDGLGQLGLVEDDYKWITEKLVEVADKHAGGRIVSCLEGGYNLNALARSVGAHLKVLTGA
jgi:acetoin utilization deacetylase AcuC-like enzyme